MLHQRAAVLAATLVAVLAAMPTGAQSPPPVAATPPVASTAPSAPPDPVLEAAFPTEIGGQPFAVSRSEQLLAARVTSLEPSKQLLFARMQLGHAADIDRAEPLPLLGEHREQFLLHTAQFREQAGDGGFPVNLLGRRSWNDHSDGSWRRSEGCCHGTRD